MPSGKTFVETPLSLAAPFVDITLARMRSWNGRKTSGVVLDPGCGRGTFLELLRQNLAGFSIWGVEKDPGLAREAADATLDSRGPADSRVRVFTGDFFFGSWRDLRDGGGVLQPRPSSFQAIVGNPPYLGFKAQGAALRRRLAGVYGRGFGKSDLSCFAVARSLELVGLGGLLALILPRYWLDGDSGATVRRLLEERCDRLEIRTWGDGQVFPGAGVHALCLWARKRNGSGRGGRLDYVVLREGQLKGRPLGRRRLSWPSPRGLWPLLLEGEERFLDSLRRTGFPLHEWAEPAQGIITGADRTRGGSAGTGRHHGANEGIFVLTKDEVRRLRLSRQERRHFHPWIKSRHIQPLRVIHSDLFLLHLPPDILWSRLPRLREHLDRHRDRLESRREVRSGKVPWWCLQWGRSEKLLSGHRVLMPAKAQRVRAAVAPEGTRFSADIYSWAVRSGGPAAGSGVAPDVVAFWLALYLSSRVGRLASRLLGKKMGSTVELYPQTQKDVPVPDPGPEGWGELGPIFRKLEATSSSDGAVLADVVTDSILGRLGVAQRAGREILGSVHSPGG